MKISSEFSKYASGYNTYNIIQKKVIDKLLSKLITHPKNILDLGCGNGALLEAIGWDYKHFVGVDFAQGMLELHPKSDKIECLYGDFNEKELFKNLSTSKFEHIFSASALQWASNLDEVFANIKSLNAPVSLAIFTSGTFETLNITAGLEPLLKDSSSIEKLAGKYFDADFEGVQYKLEFDSVREMFRYIKKSGVSGGRKVLDYKQTKKLMKEYPLSYLEFEIVFITSFTQ